MMQLEVLPTMRRWTLPFLTLIGFWALIDSTLAQSNRVSAGDSKAIAAAAFDEGQNAQQRGDLNSAVVHYGVAIKADPGLYQAYYQRATALMRLFRETEAEGDLRKVIELEPSFARAHRALGQLMLDRGKLDEARRELGRAIELDPSIKDARLYYASALLQTGESELASRHLKLALEQGEDVALTHALLGVAFERLGQLDQAASEFSRAIEMEPGIATAREGRARAFERRGDLTKAIEDYSIAYRSQPSPELAMKLAQLHGRAGQPIAAIQLYRDLLVKRPDDLGLRTEMLRLMAENGQSEEATRELGKLIAARPNDARLLILAGDLSMREHPEAAVGYYERALALDPNQNRARVQLGASLVRNLEFERALPVLAEAVNREPDNYTGHANLGTALFKLKQYPRAAGEFAWLIKAKPEIAASYFFLAISLDRIGDCERALRTYQEFARRADPAANKKELEEANIRLSLLARLAKQGKCKSPGVRSR